LHSRQEIEGGGHTWWVLVAGEGTEPDEDQGTWSRAAVVAESSPRERESEIESTRVNVNGGRG